MVFRNYLFRHFSCGVILNLSKLILLNSFILRRLSSFGHVNIFLFIVIIYINEPHCNIMELLSALYCCIILVQLCGIYGFHHISSDGRTFTLFF